MEGLPAGGAAARRPTSRWRRKPARDAAHGLRSGALALASALCAGRCLLAGAPAAPAGRGRPSGSRGVLRLAAEGEAEFKPVVFDDSYDSYANRDERLRIPDYAVWILPRKKAAQQLLAWAEEEGVTEEQSDYLRDLAEKEVPKDWGVWALADSRGLETGGGFYMLPPRSPQVGPGSCVLPAS
ncbi:unnamed protein product [Prorocentrum cordatum]|uniref:Uncharacterized protein n=1 Tax=Prorocentrum cordatum TaxID=2364126 RepID=A0ABN9T457_9DINO|nr:unnamed protein product [Polarella glacialis]